MNKQISIPSILLGIFTVSFLVIKALLLMHMLDESVFIHWCELGCVSAAIPLFIVIAYRLNRNIKIERLVRKSIEDLLNGSALVSKTNKQGDIIYVNEIFSRVSGYRQHELLGKNHRVLNSGKHSKDFWSDMYRTTVQFKTTWNDVVTNKTKKGEEYTVNSWIAADFDQQGRHIGFTSVRQDITELLKNIEKINRKEREIVNVLNAINKSSAVVEYCVEGRIRTANSNFLRMTGYTLEELVEKHHSILVEDKKKYDESYHKFWSEIKSGEYKTGQFKRVHRDGSILWVYSTFNPIMGKDGRPYKIMEILTDITSTINQQQEIEKKNVYLEHAAKILRHDMHSGINTYIPRGVSSLERRLKKLFESSDIPESQIEKNIAGPMKLIKEGLAHAQKVYKGVREFTDIVKKDSRLEKELYDISEILTLFLKGTSYSSQVKIEHIGQFEVNESLFCTAIDNLIRNGLKYNDSPSKMVKIYKEQGCIVVEDNGRGMTPEEFEEYSKPYTRKKDNVESGSGLGLNICAAIMKEHGFEITCEKSEIGTKLKIHITK